MFDSLFGDIANETRPVGDVALATMFTVPETPRGVVLLAHGITGSKEDFILAVPALAAAGYAAVAWDHRGVLDSTHRGPYDLPTLATDALGLLRHWRERLGVPAHLLGHSYGGLIAQRAVLTDPRAAASLTMLCSGPGGMGPTERVQVLRDLIAQGLSLSEIYRRKRELDAEELPEFLENFLRERFVGSDRGLIDAMAAAIMDTPDQIAALLERGDAPPAFVLYGERDGSWPQAVQNDMAARLGVAPQVVPDAEHSPALENVDDTVALVVANLDSVAAA